jgi:hypothetical protein
MDNKNGCVLSNPWKLEGKAKNQKEEIIYNKMSLIVDQWIGLRWAINWVV